MSSGLAALSCGSNLTCTLGNTSLSACFMVAVVTVPGVLPGVVARMIVGCRSIVCPARVVVTVTVCIWSVAALISSMSSCFMNVWPSIWPWPCWCAAAAAWFCLWIVRFSGLVVFVSSLSKSEKKFDKTCVNFTLHCRFRNFFFQIWSCDHESTDDVFREN